MGGNGIRLKPREIMQKGRMIELLFLDLSWLSCVGI